MREYLTVWTKPDQTAQQLINHRSIWYGLLIVLISGLGSSVFVFADNGLLADLSLSAILFISFGLTIIAGTIFYFINAGVYFLISKMLGGTGKFKDNALAVSAGSLPMIVILPIGIVAVALYGHDLYAELLDPFAITNMSAGFYVLYMIVLAGATIFGIVILSRSLGYANGFSAMRGFGVLLIYAAIVFAITFVFIIIAIVIGFMFFSAVM